jgi:hypothetical protein
VLIANTLTVSEHGVDSNSDADMQLVTEVLAFLQRGATEMPDWDILRKMHEACAELSCRARIAGARFALGRPGLKPTSIAWLESGARQSAGQSALTLVEAFTRAEQKPIATRLWRVAER